jgi:hypothetical protein
MFRVEIPFLFVLNELGEVYGPTKEKNILYGLAF